MDSNNIFNSRTGLMRILMVRLANSSIRNDSRVLREAESLQSLPAEVSILEAENSHYQAGNSFEVCGIPVVVLPMRTKFLRMGMFGWLVKYLEYFFRVVGAILRRRPNVVHVHDLDPLLPSWVGARLCGATVIYDSHELYTEQDGQSKGLKTIWRIVERFLLIRVDGVIAANRSRARIMHEEYGAPRLPSVVMNIPAPPADEPASNRNVLRDYLATRVGTLKTGGWIVLYQGGLVPLRGLEELVDAMKLVPEGIYLVLMGYGPLTQSLMQRIEEGGLQHRVFLHPAVPANVLHGYTSSADLGVITYKATCLNKYYCAPNKLFEYVMAGIPFVGADLPEIRRIVDGYGVGHLFAPDSPASIAQAIVTQLNVMKKNREASEKGLRAIRADYTWQHEEETLHSLYGEVVGRGGMKT
ncbi:glycosyltransferase [Thiovibrio sp. JS02]